MQRFFFPFCGLIFTLLAAYLMSFDEYWFTYFSSVPCALVTLVASQVALVVKNPHANAGELRDAGSIPGSGRTPGEGHGNLLQYSCLKNPMDRRAMGRTESDMPATWKLPHMHASTLVTYPNLRTWSFPSSFSSKSSIFVSVCEGLWCICWCVCVFIIPYLKQQQIPTLCRFVSCHWLAFTDKLGMFLVLGSVQQFS